MSLEIDWNSFSMCPALGYSSISRKIAAFKLVSAGRISSPWFITVCATCSPGKTAAGISLEPSPVLGTGEHVGRGPSSKMGWEYIRSITQLPQWTCLLTVTASTTAMRLVAKTPKRPVLFGRGKHADHPETLGLKGINKPSFWQV